MFGSVWSIVSFVIHLDKPRAKEIKQSVEKKVYVGLKNVLCDNLFLRSNALLHTLLLTLLFAVTLITGLQFKL